jgi:acyl carrier protein
VENSIKQNIIFWFLKKGVKLSEKTDLFSSNLIDSFGFIELLLYLEKKYKIKLNHKNIFLKKKLLLTDLVLAIRNCENKNIKKK